MCVSERVVYLNNVGFFYVQMEEPSILSDGEDAVDSRQWTQHHLAAADIRMPPSMALTPPQGEFDSDCMDVNVRGPGTICLTVYSYFLVRSSCPTLSMALYI